MSSIDVSASRTSAHLHSSLAEVARVRLGPCTVLFFQHSCSVTPASTPPSLTHHHQSPLSNIVRWPQSSHVERRQPARNYAESKAGSNARDELGVSSCLLNNHRPRTVHHTTIRSSSTRKEEEAWTSRKWTGWYASSLLVSRRCRRSTRSCLGAMRRWNGNWLRRESR